MSGVKRDLAMANLTWSEIDIGTDHPDVPAKRSNFWTWDVANPRATTSIYLFCFYCHGRGLSQEAYHLGNFLRNCTLASIWYLILFIYLGTLWIKFCS